MRERISRPLFSPDDTTPSSLRIVVRFDFVSHPQAVRIAGHVVHAVLAATTPLFLLPGPKSPQLPRSYPGETFRRRFTDGSFRKRNANLFAANQILDSTRAMVDADSTDSKLCAEVPRHASRNFLSEISAAQLGKGQGFAPPRCIPSLVPQAAAETVPVSAPSARCAAVAFAVWAVRP